jgi:Zn-dependent protease
MHQVREDAKRKTKRSASSEEYEENQTWARVMPGRNQKRKMVRQHRKRFSNTEKRHLLIASILVTLVAISNMGTSYGIVYALQRFVFFILSPYWWVPVGMILIFLLSFMGHELAHKFTAQHYGMWSEFRMNSMGYYLSAIAIIFSIPIFGTGTMYTSGTTNREHDAKTNLAGPLSNFVFASGLVLIAIVAVFTMSGIALGNLIFLVQYGVIINAVLGLFNMIPIQPFDGATVKDWSLPVWIALTIALVAMLVIGYLVIPILPTVS